MRASLTLVFLLSAQPAFACHRYSTWSYPWPQSCKATSARPAPLKIAALPPAPRPAIVPTVEDPARVQAIERLKQALRSRAGQELELQTIGLTTEEKRNGN
jgi:hypothetical protein